MHHARTHFWTLFLTLFTAAAAVLSAAEPTQLNWKQAQWIGYTNDTRDAEWAARLFQAKRQPQPVSRSSFPSPLLRKAFTVEKAVRSARISVCGVGYYECYLNGEKVGDRVLDPAQTTYNKRAFYVTHEITRQLQKGGNALGLMLGSGFYGQNTAFGGGLVYGPPRAILLLDIDYTDGSKQTIVSDDTWKAAQGPVLFDNVYAGETFDARRVLADWSRPGFDDAAWQSVAKMPAPTTRLEQQQLEPMRKVRAIKPVSMSAAKDGDWVLDMGQNMTGWLQIRVQESSGSKIQLRFAEVLTPDGKAIDTVTTGGDATGCDQMDIYLCKGGGVESWEPRFTYHGFRYVQIGGLSKKPELGDFTGWLVRTDVASVGSFECSDALINKFYNVSMWTIEDNLQGLLSDCPHRERCAWMGDGHAVGEAASYNFDLARFWPKVTTDIETVLGANPPSGMSKVKMPFDKRAPTMIAVGKRLCGQATADWGAATVLVPWYDFLFYGDLKTVKAAWPMMQGWMAFLYQFGVKDGIVADGLGDWCPPGSNIRIDCPVALSSTALYYQSLQAMHTMALAIGAKAAADRYAAEAVTIKEAFIKRFYDPVNHHFKSQTGTSVALHAGLAPAGEEAKVADGLAKLIMEKAKGHYATGIFGHRPLYTVLNDYGHAEVTRHLWSITDWPSLGFLTEKHDLTVWPEVPLDWQAGKRYPANSFNHPMHAGFAASFHESLGGIRPDPAGPGFKRFFLKPCFLPGLEWVKVGYRSASGMITSHWKRDGHAVVWEVSVPLGTIARVQLPQYPTEKISLAGKTAGQNDFELAPGQWSLRITE